MQARVLVDEYSTKGDSLANAFLDLNNRYMQAIRPYKVTRADFEPLRTKMIGLRRNYTDYLVYMRFKLIALTPEKQWEGLAKELNYFAYQIHCYYCATSAPRLPYFIIIEPALPTPTQNVESVRIVSSIIPNPFMG
jgi:hypothetical protein